MMGCCIKYSTMPVQTDTLDHINDSTVALVKPTEKGLRPYCTGTWISDNLILTARHCVDDKSKIYYTTYKQFNIEYPHVNDESYLGRVKYISTAEKDLAIIESISNINHGIVDIDHGSIVVGSRVHFVGHVLGMEYTYMQGIVSQERYIKDVMEIDAKLLQITSLVGPGMSGGGVFTDDGKLIGVTSFGITDVPGMNFFIHRDEIVDFLKQKEIYLQ